MKPSPRSNYPIGVQPEYLEAPEASMAHLYEGIYTMILNYTVRIVFVPDVSAVAPPWDGRGLPEDIDQVATPEQARYATALFASYVVTPNADRVGQVDRFRFPPQDPRGDDSLVRYVDPAEYGRFVGDLQQISEITNSLHPDKTVVDLRAYEVVRWVEAEVVGATWFLPRDAAWLRDSVRGAPAGPA